MTRGELQDEFDMLADDNEQTYFIDQNLEHASDIALADELIDRGYRVRM